MNEVRAIDPTGYGAFQPTRRFHPVSLRASELNAMQCPHCEAASRAHREHTLARIEENLEQILV